jgi:hypothetical protein
VRRRLRLGLRSRWLRLGLGLRGRRLRLGLRTRRLGPVVEALVAALLHARLLILAICTSTMDTKSNT